MAEGIRSVFEDHANIVSGRAPTLRALDRDKSPLVLRADALDARVLPALQPRQQLDLRMERRNLGSENELRRFEHRQYCVGDFLLDRPVLRVEIEERDRCVGRRGHRTTP